jgi:hypothetical protein
MRFVEREEMLSGSSGSLGHFGLVRRYFFLHHFKKIFLKQSYLPKTAV